MRSGGEPVRFIRAMNWECLAFTGMAELQAPLRRLLEDCLRGLTREKKDTREWEIDEREYERMRTCP